MKIAILQAGEVPNNADFDDYDMLFIKMLGKNKHNFSVYKVFDDKFPTANATYDAYIITGSASGVYEKKDWMLKLEKLVQKIACSNSLLLGVCFGHQIIAEALGGKVEKFRGGISIGLCEYKINGEAVNALAWHQDQIVSLPKNAKVIGSSDFCQYAVLEYGENILTCQFHPEFTSRTIEGLLQIRENILDSKVVEKAKISLTALPNNKKDSYLKNSATTLINDFLRK